MKSLTFVLLPDIARVLGARRILMAGCVARIEQILQTFKILVGNKPLVRLVVVFFLKLLPS